MSKFVKVKTELRDLALIKQSLADLKLAYGENERYAHVWSGYHDELPLVVKQARATFGFRLNGDGVYEAVAASDAKTLAPCWRLAMPNSTVPGAYSKADSSRNFGPAE